MAFTPANIITSSYYFREGFMPRGFGYNNQTLLDNVYAPDYISDSDAAIHDIRSGDLVVVQQSPSLFEFAWVIEGTAGAKTLKYWRQAQTAYANEFTWIFDPVTSRINDKIAESKIVKMDTITSSTYNIEDDDAELLIFRVPVGGTTVTLDDNIKIGRTFKIHRSIDNENEELSINFPWTGDPVSEFDYPVPGGTNIQITRIAEDEYVVELH